MGNHGMPTSLPAKSGAAAAGRESLFAEICVNLGKIQGSAARHLNDLMICAEISDMRRDYTGIFFPPRMIYM